MSLFSASSQQEVGAAKALLCRNNFPLSRQKVMWFSRPSDPPPDEALDADEREEVRSQAEEMGELLHELVRSCEPPYKTLADAPAAAAAAL